MRVPIDALVYMTLVTPEIVFGISALIFFVQAGNWLGLGSVLGLKTILIAHVVFNASVVALIVRARFVGHGADARGGVVRPRRRARWRRSAR